MPRFTRTVININDGNDNNKSSDSNLVAVHDIDQRLKC